MGENGRSAWRKGGVEREEGGGRGRREGRRICGLRGHVCVWELIETGRSSLLERGTLGLSVLSQAGAVLR
eukprot:scaffold184975_cov35-Tisochrysis_lutea.AAC.1